MPTTTTAPSVVIMSLNNHAVAVVLALGMSVGVSACGGEPEVCDDVDALRADLDDLTTIEIQPGSLADFSAALDEVDADVDQLVESAEAEYESEIDAIQSATQALTTSVEAATQAPSGPAITQVSADFGAFSTAVGNLRDAVSGTC
jgi:hypothetical protein